MQIESKFFLEVVGTPYHYLAKMNSFNLYALTGGGEQKTSNPARARALRALALGTRPPWDRTPGTGPPPNSLVVGSKKLQILLALAPCSHSRLGPDPPGTGPPGTGPPLNSLVVGSKKLQILLALGTGPPGTGPPGTGPPGPDPPPKFTGGGEQKNSNPARTRPCSRSCSGPDPPQTGPPGTGPPPPKFTGGGEQKTSNPARARDRTPRDQTPPKKNYKLCRVQ